LAMQQATSKLWSQRFTAHSIANCRSTRRSPH